MMFWRFGADQRKAHDACKLGWFSLSWKGFGFWVLDRHSQVTADQREARFGVCLSGRFLLEAVEEFALGLLHGQRGFGIGLHLSKALQIG